MAGETVQSGFTTVAAYVAGNISPYFRTNVVMLGNVAAQNFKESSGDQPGSKSLIFGKRGAVTVSVTAEAAAATKSTYAETNVSITALKATAYVELTNESELFGNSAASLDYLTQDAGAACAQKFDVDTLALADSFTNSTGTTNTPLTVTKLKDAAYKVRLSKVPGPLVYVLHSTQIRDLQGDIITSTAPVWGNSQTTLDVLNGQPAASNGRVGSIFGVDVFETTNTKSINAGVDWAGICFNPRFAFAAGLLGRFVTMIGPMPQQVQNGLSVSMYYQVAKWNDGAGAYIISKQ